MRARFTEAAVDDLTQARAFVASKFGTQVRTGLNAELQRAVALLREHPSAGKSAGSAAREYVLDGYPYSLVYFVEDDEVVIAALAHHRRDPQLWRDRFAPGC